MHLSRKTGVLLALIACGVPAFAHHSFAMFDGTREVSIEGTVKELQWTNPHVWLQVLVPNGQGGEDEFSLEGLNVSAMRNAGWTRNIVKPGDRVKVTLHPMRNGSKGGGIRTVELPDGRVLASGAPQTIGGGQAPAP